eukprot:806840-Rhodomonas_salina.2
MAWQGGGSTMCYVSTRDGQAHAQHPSTGHREQIASLRVQVRAQLQQHLEPRPARRRRCAACGGARVSQKKPRTKDSAECCVGAARAEIEAVRAETEAMPT